MLLDREVVWEWKDYNYDTAKAQIFALEDKHLREVVWRIWIYTRSSKGEGHARVSQLIIGYETWLALEKVSEGILEFLDLAILQPKGKGNEDIPELMMRMWNEVAGAKLPKVKSLTSDRRSKCRARWEEFPSPKGEYYEEVLKKCVASRFLTGTNDRNWRADFDFILRPNSHAKVSEGKYDDRTIQKAVQGGGFDALKNFGWGTQTDG